MGISRKKILIIFIFFLFSFLLTINGHYGSDGFYSYLTAESIVLDHDVSIYDRSFSVPEMSRGIAATGAKGIDGKIYSRYDILLALVEVPFYFIGDEIAKVFPPKMHDYVTMFFVSTANSFVAAFVCMIIILIGMSLKYSIRTSIFLGLVMGFGTYFWPYSRYGFSEPLLIMCFLASFYMLHCFKGEKENKYMLWAGLFFGFAVATKYNALISIFAYIIYGYLLINEMPVKGKLVAALHFLAPFAFIMYFLGLYNYIRFGSYLITGYEGPGVYFNIKYLTDSIPGFLFSYGKSIIVFAPVVVMFPFSMLKFGKIFKKESIFILLMVVSNMLAMGCFKYWEGDLSWGPRLIMPILPFMIIPIGMILKERMRVFSFLFALGFLLNLPANIINTADWAMNIGCYYYNLWLAPPLASWFQLIVSIYRMSSNTNPIFHLDGRIISSELFARYDIWFMNVQSIKSVALNLASIVTETLFAAVALIAYARFRGLLSIGNDEAKKQ